MLLMAAREAELALPWWTGIFTTDERHNRIAPQQAGQGEQIVTIQNVYFNGFVLGISNADTNALLLIDGQPLVRLNMSYTTAKTLLVKLGELVGRFEAATQHNIMLTDEVEA